MFFFGFFATVAYPLLYIMSVIAFAVVAYDKHLAACGLRRVPEVVIGLLSLGFGAFGTLCSMILFGHYTDRKPFIFGVPALLVLQLAFLVIKIKTAA